MSFTTPKTVGTRFIASVNSLTGMLRNRPYAQSMTRHEWRRTR
jgi:hypothetical protein